MRVYRFHFDIPKACAASISPWGIERIAPAKISVVYAPVLSANAKMVQFIPLEKKHQESGVHGYNQSCKYLSK